MIITFLALAKTIIDLSMQPNINTFEKENTPTQSCCAIVSSQWLEWKRDDWTAYEDQGTYHIRRCSDIFYSICSTNIDRSSSRSPCFISIEYDPNPRSKNVTINQNNTELLLPLMVQLAPRSARGQRSVSITRRYWMRLYSNASSISNRRLFHFSCQLY
jgi:hypothetical protein